MTFGFNVDVLWLSKSDFSKQLSVNATGHVLFRKIGSGSFGNVFMTQRLEDRKILAVKIMKRKNVDLSGLASELRVMSLPDAPVFLHQMVDSFPYQSCYWIVSELCRGTLGHFSDSERRRKKVKSWQVKELMFELFSALNYLHSHSWMHGDVKPENVLITAAGRTKLTDFSCSFWFDKHKETGLKFPKSFGTPAYMAPEVYKKAVVNCFCDLFSAGATIYDLLRGCVPHKRHGANWIQYHSKHAKGKDIDEATRDYGGFVAQLLDRDYKKRIKAVDRFLRLYKKGRRRDGPIFVIDPKPLGKPLSRKKFLLACPDGQVSVTMTTLLKKHKASPEECKQRVLTAEMGRRMAESNFLDVDESVKSCEVSPTKSEDTMTATTTTGSSSSNSESKNGAQTADIDQA